MFETLRNILEITLERLSSQITTYLPGLLAALTIVLGAYLMARLTRWLMNKIFKGMALDRFLQQSGLSTLLSRSGSLRATRSRCRIRLLGHSSCGTVHWTERF